VTPTLRWNRRSSSSSAPPDAMTSAKASVISSCGYRCSGRAPRTARMRIAGAGFTGAAALPGMSTPAVVDIATGVLGSRAPRH
jgi:hypothetical protein